jgi:rubredoxin
MTIDAWKCTICHFVLAAERPPGHCPECSARDAMFEKTNEAPHPINHNPLQPRDERDQVSLDFAPGVCITES